VIALGEHKDDRTSIEGEVCLVARRIRRQVGVVKHGEVREGFVGCAVLLVGLIVHHRDLEFVLFSQALHQRVTFINERLTVAIPIDYEGGNSH